VIEPSLDELVKAELIDQIRFTPRAQYAFRHPLVRAVAYESQLKSDRAQLHRRLAWTFRGEVTSFERKLYSSLSQEANKAMNLNSYIGLMGHSFEVKETPQGQVLSAAGASGSLVIPDADFILTLDADSIVLPVLRSVTLNTPLSPLSRMPSASQ